MKQIIFIFIIICVAIFGNLIYEAKQEQKHYKTQSATTTFYITATTTGECFIFKAIENTGLYIPLIGKLGEKFEKVDC